MCIQKFLCLAKYNHDSYISGSTIAALSSTLLIKCFLRYDAISVVSGSGGYSLRY